MGAYFSVFGIRKVSAQHVLAALKKWEQPGGDLADVYDCISGHSLILWGTIPADGEGLAEGLTQDLHTPVLRLVFADDVVWSYGLHTESGLVDEYDSRPNYWEKKSDVTHLAGNAQKVCEVWGGVEGEKINRYLVNKETLAEDERTSRAYPDDQAPQWDAWQMCDFMRRLGLDYPITEESESIDPQGYLTICTARGLTVKAQERRASAEVEDQVHRLKAEGKWPGYEPTNL